MVTFRSWGRVVAGRCARLGLVIAGLVVVPTWSGCASVDRSNLPWWVASPSAPLPAGFPAPGPVGEVKVKEYPAYRAAVNRPADGAGDSSLFFPLYHHIERNHIAMSSPVEMTYSGAAAKPARSMGFIYGDLSVGKPGRDGTVEVVDVPAQLMASLGVTGSYTEERYQEALVRLEGWLNEHASEYAISGDPRLLAYNSPFVLPYARYGEVQIPVTRRTEARDKP